MSEGIHDEPLPLDPRLEHPATEWGANAAAPAQAPPQSGTERPIRWTPLAEELARYGGDGEESREVL